MMLDIWHYCFDMLKPDPEDVEQLHFDNLMVSHNQFNKATKERMVQLVFEKLHCENFQMQDQTILSLYSHGVLTGMTLNIGDSLSYTMPVFEGYGIAHASIESIISG